MFGDYLDGCVSEHFSGKPKKSRQLRSSSVLHEEESENEVSGASGVIKGDGVVQKFVVVVLT